MPLKQARKAAKFAGPILGPAFFNHGGGGIRHDDLARSVSTGPQHPHRMVMGQHQMADRLVGHLPHAINHLARKARRGLRLDDHHALIANDDPRVRVPLGGKGVNLIADFGECGLFLGQIPLRGEGFGNLRRSFSVLGPIGQCGRGAQGAGTIAKPDAIARAHGGPPQGEPVSILQKAARAARIQRNRLFPAP